MTKQIVKFTRPWSAYTAGDIAGFDEVRAKSLVAGNVAVPYAVDDAAEKKDPPAAKTDKKSGK